MIVCSLPFSLEVSLDFEGISIFSFYLERAAKVLVSFCSLLRKVPVLLRKRCLVIGFLQHLLAQPPLQLRQCSASQSALQPPGR